MSVQVAGLCEPLPALIANVWLVLGMFPHMDLKDAVPVELLAAILALEVSEIQMAHVDVVL